MKNTFSIYTLPGWKGSVFKFDEKTKQNKTKIKENNLKNTGELNVTNAVITY